MTTIWVGGLQNRGLTSYTQMCTAVEQHVTGLASDLNTNL